MKDASHGIEAPCKRWLFRLRPPGHAALLLALALAAHYAWPAARVMVLQFHPGAWLAGIGGGSVAAWGILCFRRKGTNLVPGKPVLHFVSDGPFRFTRNPMYLGLLGAHLSFALGYGTLPFYLSLAATFAVLRTLYIPYEEALMQRQYGAAYEDYRRRVRRWL